MRIGLVADTLSLEAGTGIARYCRELQMGLSRRDQDTQVLCFPPPRFPLGMVIHHATRMPFVILRQARGLDLIHATNPACAFAFPFVRKPKVVTYHDLVSLLCPGTSHSLHTRLLAPFILRIGKFANRIIADSSQTRKELIVHLGVPEDKITVVNLGVDARFTWMKVPTQDYYVVGYVGALSRRKKLGYLLRAFCLLRDRYPEIPVRLVICGSKHLEYPALAGLACELGIADDVEFRGFVPDDRLVEVYNSFDVFVVPSEWEGFGLPVLEAQRCGVPVIVREDAHIPPEVSTCCLKSRSVRDMADKIHQLITDRDIRLKIIEEGMEYSRNFTWERMVKTTLNVYEDIL